MFILNMWLQCLFYTNSGAGSQGLWYSVVSDHCWFALQSWLPWSVGLSQCVPCRNVNSSDKLKWNCWGCHKAFVLSQSESKNNQIYISTCLKPSIVSCSNCWAIFLSPAANWMWPPLWGPGKLGRWGSWSFEILQRCSLRKTETMTAWWFGTWFFFHSVGNNNPNWLFFRGLKPPTRWFFSGFITCVFLKNRNLPPVIEHSNHSSICCVTKHLQMKLDG